MMKKHFLLSAMVCTTTFSNSYAQTSCAQAYESNNTRPAAYSISPGNTYNAAIATAGDIDLYKITIPAGGYTVTLTNVTHDIDMSIDDINGSSVASSLTDGIANEQITATLAAGTYYIRVYGYGGSYNANSCYALKMTSNAQPSNCAQAYENNNTLATAYPVSFGVDYQAAVAAPGDMDYYKITIPSGNFTVSLTNVTHDIDMSIDDASGVSVASSLTNGIANEQITASLNAGTYYVRIYGYYNSFNAGSCYKLRIKNNNATECEQALEPDNDQNTATYITLGTEYHATIGSQGDVDYYKIWVGSGAWYKATLTGLTYDGVLNEMVYTASGYSGGGNGQSQHPGTANESLTTQGNGWLVFKVSSIGASSETDPNHCYTFKVVPLNSTASLQSWNNQLAEASPIVLYPNPATDRLTLKLDKQSAGAQIRVFDLAGKEVMLQKAVEGENVMNIAPLASGNYMISVENGRDRIHQKFTKQ